MFPDVIEMANNLLLIHIFVILDQLTISLNLYDLIHHMCHKQHYMTANMWCLENDKVCLHIYQTW